MVDKKWQVAGDDVGLFEGVRTCVNPLSEHQTRGTQYVDQEVCFFEEFEIID